MSSSGWRPERPYNDLPPIPSADTLESKPVLRACVEARAALAGLKQAAQLIPNQAILINTLPVLEAQASSAIENIVTTADKIFENLNAEAGAESRVQIRRGSQGIRRAQAEWPARSCGGACAARA